MQMKIGIHRHEEGQTCSNPAWWQRPRCTGLLTWLKRGNWEALRWGRSCKFGYSGQGCTHFCLSGIKLKWNTHFRCCCWWISNSLSGLCTFSVRCGLLKWMRGRSLHLSELRPAPHCCGFSQPLQAWTKRSIWQTTFTAGPTEIHARASCYCHSIIFSQSRAPDTSDSTEQ